MSIKTPRFRNQVRACRLVVCVFAWMGAAAAGCSGGHDADDGSPAPPNTSGSGAAAGAGAGSPAAGGTGGSKAPVNSGTQAGRGGQSAQSGAGSMTNAGSGGGGMGGAGNSASGSGGAAGTMFVEATCGASDKPETGLQGGVYPGTVNCGLTLLAEIPGGGHAQGSGHCAYVRGAGSAPYQGSTIKAYSLADPLNPMMTDMEPAIGGSESMRAHTVEGRAVLVSGSGVYDISNCEDIVKKGEIPWPSENAMNGLYFAALSSHEISISHDARRVYSGLGFAVAHIEDLDKPYTVNDWACEMNKQSDFPTDVPNACDGPIHQDVGRQYSHSSDDNLEGTVWYGANQNGDGFSAMEPSTARMVDISDPNSIKILDTVHEFPGHSMNWWRTPDNREFIIGANEGFGGADTCMQYPRPTNLGNAEDAYIVEVTGKKFGTPFTLTLDVNKPENCMAAKSSGARASITEHSVYNKNGAAFVMIEFGGAGLRVFDLRDGEHPREVAYYNDGKGHVHSGVFHYDEARGIMLASGSSAVHVLMLQPQIIAALGLPKPTDPKYPYK